VGALGRPVGRCRRFTNDVSRVIVAGHGHLRGVSPKTTASATSRGPNPNGLRPVCGRLTPPPLRMKFQPGQSGNPHGRPAVAREFRQRSQDFMDSKGWRQLEDMAMDRKSPHRFRALELLAAYAYGRPTQPIGGDPDPDEPPVRVTITFDRADDPETSRINGLTELRHPSRTGE